MRKLSILSEQPGAVQGCTALEEKAQMNGAVQFPGFLSGILSRISPVVATGIPPEFFFCLLEFLKGVLPGFR